MAVRMLGLNCIMMSDDSVLSSDVKFISGCKAVKFKVKSKLLEC